MEPPHHTTNPWGGSADLPPIHPPPPHPHRARTPLASLINIGLLKSTLLPSLAVTTPVTLLAYAAGRLTDRLDTKDLAWSAGPVLCAWHAAVLRHTSPFAAPGTAVSLRTAWRVLTPGDKLLLGGVTLWGGRLLYRVATRARARGRDDPRYEAVKHRRGLELWGGKRPVKKGGFWDWAWLTVYLPEAVFQSVIALSVTTPFRMGLLGLREGTVWGASGGWKDVAQGVAVGLFSAGLALEVLADWQLGEFKERADSQGKMCREGVWGVVRHPNYLGDALVHFSFPLLLFANNMLAPVALLGPLTNYLFLRFVGGDKENEEYQARRYGAEDVTKKIDFDKYRHERNAFWPDVSQVHNKWAWIVVGCGVAGALVETAVRKLM